MVKVATGQESKTCTEILTFVCPAVTGLGWPRLPASLAVPYSLHFQKAAGSVHVVMGLLPWNSSATLVQIAGV